MFWSLLLLVFDLYIVIHTAPYTFYFFFKFKVLCKTLYSQFCTNLKQHQLTFGVLKGVTQMRWVIWEATHPLGMSYIGISRLMYSSLFPAGLLSCVTPKGIVHIVLWNWALRQHSLRCSLRLYKKCRWSIYSHHNS